VGPIQSRSARWSTRSRTAGAAGPWLRSSSFATLRPKLQLREIRIELQANRGLRLHGYVVLENHLHPVARAPALGKDVQRFKSFTAMRILAVLEEAKATRLLSMLRVFKAPHKMQSQYQVWDEGSHPQRIEDEDVMRQKLEITST
jgi:hypothetical protein